MDITVDTKRIIYRPTILGFTVYLFQEYHPEAPSKSYVIATKDRIRPFYRGDTPTLLFKVYHLIISTLQKKLIQEPHDLRDGQITAIAKDKTGTTLFIKEGLVLPLQESSACNYFMLLLQKGDLGGPQRDVKLEIQLTEDGKTYTLAELVFDIMPDIVPET